MLHACVPAEHDWKTLAPTVNACAAPTHTTPASSTAPSIPSPPLLPLAPATKPLSDAVRSSPCRTAAARAPLHGRQSAAIPPPSPLSCECRFLLLCKPYLPPGVEAVDRAEKWLRTVTRYHPSYQEG